MTEETVGLGADTLQLAAGSFIVIFENSFSDTKVRLQFKKIF
jgi:hypothetical protein